MYFSRSVNVVKSSLVPGKLLRYNLCRRQLLSTSFSSDAKTRKSLRLYRILLRQCQRLFAHHEEWLLQPPLHPRDSGKVRSFRVDPEVHHDRAVFDVLNLFWTWSRVGQDDDDSKGLSTWFLSVLQDTDYYKEQVLRDSGKMAEWQEEFEQQIDNDDDDSTNGGDVEDSLWVSHRDLKQTIRHGFQSNLDSSQVNADTMSPIHGLGIRAVRLLNEQESMMERTSVSVKNGIRVVATSRCVGTVTNGGSSNTLTTSTGESSSLQQGLKHRIAYRIRVENLPTNDETVQLLGRTWNIQETNEQNQVVGDPVHVVAPTTGVVGYLPVLQPGQVFAYMSGCELSTETGVMEGCLHMAVVPPDTESAIIGDAVVALSSGKKFEAPVKPFLLLAK